MLIKPQFSLANNDVGLIYCLHNLQFAQYLLFKQYMLHMPRIFVCYIKNVGLVYQEIDMAASREFPHPLDQSIYLNSGFKSPNSVFS